MVYKLGNLKDLESLPAMDKITYGVLWEFTSVLTNEYGEDRDIDNDDGGFVLYATPGTSPEEVKNYFNYDKYTLEYVNRTLQADPPICSALYLLNNDYAIVLVFSLDDCPHQISECFEEGY